MKRPPRAPDENIVSGFMLWRILFVGILLVAGTLGHYTLMLDAGTSREMASTAAINALVVGQVFYLFNSRFILEPSWKLSGFTGNRAVLISVAILAVLQLAFTYLPQMQYIFQTEPLPAGAWISIFAFGIALFILVEIEKAIMAKRQQ